MWRGRRGHRAVAWALAIFSGTWLCIGYAMTFKYLKDMYHLRNVHVLEFSLYERGNAWVLAREALHWWHVPVVLTAFMVCPLWLVNSFRRFSPGIGALRS